jgi:hypothetical protein
VLNQIGFNPYHMINNGYELTIHFFDAGGGDVKLIRSYGYDDAWHNMLTDGSLSALKSNQARKL